MKYDAKLLYVEGRVEDGTSHLYLSIIITEGPARLKELKAALDGVEECRVSFYKDVEI